MSKFIKTHLLVICFLVFYFSITAYKFAAHPTPFYDWDESIYAQVGKEMVNQKSLVPLWQGQNWLDKPPLVPLAYGIVESTVPLPPELSTRLFTLLLSIAALFMVYLLYYRLTKNTLIPLLTVVITSFTPIFLQRSQVLNVDIFLFIGWLGYLLWYENFWPGLFFLAVGVLSKSLLGFYPVLILMATLSFQLYRKKIKKNEYLRLLKHMLIQSGILSLWYIAMIAVFKYSFIKAHFLESQIKRVTSSIESHFGKRTFYIDELAGQLGIFSLFAVIGFLLLCAKSYMSHDLMYFAVGAFFIPWFLFLNLTKTKISWYLYPVLAQFSFLASYVLVTIRKHVKVTLLVTLAVTFVVFRGNILNGSFFDTHYSSYDQYYQLAIYAKKHCNNLTVLIDRSTRTADETLQNMNLLISTSEWWGNHPSIVFYSSEHVSFIYHKNTFADLLKKLKTRECYALDTAELDPNIPTKGFTYGRSFKEMSIYIRN